MAYTPRMQVRTGVNDFQQAIQILANEAATYAHAHDM